MKYVDFNLTSDGIKYNVIEKRIDEFKHELTIYSNRLHGLYRAKWISIHGDVPINVLYKSNSSDERIFLTLDSCDHKVMGSDKIILNLDGKKNIEINRDWSAEARDEQFEITKEQLYELCMASTLKIQFSGYNGVGWEGTANGFITILQVIYNEAFDNTLFADAKKKVISYMEDAIEPEKHYEESRDRDLKTDNSINPITATVVITIGLLLFLVLVMILAT